MGNQMIVIPFGLSFRAIFMRLSSIDWLQFRSNNR